jgi:hypothetical protein
MKAAVEHIFTGPTGSLNESYNPNITMLGTLMKQYTGNNDEDKYVSTLPSSIVNIPEVTGAVAYNIPHVVKRTDNIYWIFVSGPGALVNKDFGLFVYDKSENTTTWKGFVRYSGNILLGNKTTRALRAMVTSHSDGTVSTSGTSSTISGVSTKFTDDRIAVGARIGFGSTNPENITTWYEITNINSNTELTILGGGVNLPLGTEYVIEEIRLVFSTINATATITNGSVHIMKGINYDSFTIGGTIVNDCIDTDNIRAVYTLKYRQPQTCTISQSSPAVVTANNHGYQANDIIVLTTTGALPAGLTAATTIYFVSPTDLTSNTFRLSLIPNGVLINTTTAGSGVHTINSTNMFASTGLASDDMISPTEHEIYQINLDTATFVKIHKINIRASLNVVNSIATGAISYNTQPVSIIGTAPIINNGRLFTVNHLSAAGEKSVWFVTTTRVYRCAVSAITDQTSGFISDVMIEIPPGSSTTYTLTNSMAQIDYSETLDRIIIPTSIGRFGTYIGEYDTSNLIPFEKIFGSLQGRVKLSTTPSGTIDGLFPSTTLTIWSTDGLLFAIPASAVTGLNWLFIFPFGADALYASSTNQRIITPKMATPNASKLYRAYIDHAEYIGTYELGFQPEAYKMYFRTSGIDDNTGAWVEVPPNGNLTQFAPSDFIQFMFELDTLGEVCVPTRLYSVSCVYEDGSQDSHYEPSLTKSSAQNRQFAWRQISLWGGTIPNLRLRLFNVTNGATVLDDNITSSMYGMWEYSTDGDNWLTWDTHADSIGNYIRYTANNNVIGNLITVRALLTQV